MSHFNSSWACTDRSLASTLVMGVPILRAASSEFQFVAGCGTGLARKILAAAALVAGDADSRSDLGDAQRPPTEQRDTSPTRNRVAIIRDAAQQCGSPTAAWQAGGAQKE